MSRVLIVSPDIEFKNYRGIQTVLTYILYGLEKAKYKSYLLTGFYYPESKLTPKIKDAYGNIYLRHYIEKGKEAYDNMLYKKSVLKKRINRWTIIKGIIKMSFSKARLIKIRRKEAEHMPILSNATYVANIPFIYQLIDYASVNNGISSWIVRNVLIRLLKSNNIDHIICASPLVLPKFPKSIRITQYIHDLIPLQLTEDPLEDNSPGRFAQKIEKIIKRSTDFIANSHDTAARFNELYDGLRVNVISPGPTFLINPSNYSPEIDDHILSKYGLTSKNYFFFISALEKRKNIEGLIKGYLASFKKTKKPLVIAGGKGYEFERVEQWIESELKPVEKAYIKFTGYIPESEKVSLMKHASCFLFPSFYEGFGIPVLEAFAMECAVLTTHAGGLKEAAGDAALILKDPYDHYTIGQSIIRIDKDVELQDELKKRGKEQVNSFTPDLFAEKLNDFLSNG